MKPSQLQEIQNRLRDIRSLTELINHLRSARIGMEKSDTIDVLIDNNGEFSITIVLDEARRAFLLQIIDQEITRKSDELTKLCESVEIKS